MSLVHLHLMLNHVPVVAIPIAGGLLWWGYTRGQPALVRAAFGLLLFGAIVTGIVFLTGEPAEESVEHLSGFSESLIERHESIATFALIITGLLGVLGIVGLLATRAGRTLPRGVAYAVFAATLLAVAALSATAYVGGQIRHDEIRGSTALGP